jgi:2-amino-4-hydroxy-6-hydroxymethyldihydropteridine diphosphokinase
VNDCSIGDRWFELFYPRIQRELGYEKERDEESRDILSRFLSKRENYSLDEVRKLIRMKQVIMFGAGPSLESDIAGLVDFVRKRQPVVVAADGAADALYGNSIMPAIIVSDLDSCTLESLEKCVREGHVFAHAHGDNRNLIENIMPKLRSNVLGTTQVASVKNVINYGGLTDGDRACFVISNFDPASIIIAGMDFGSSEGRYSVDRHSRVTNPARPLKLSLGKESLEFLICARPDIRFLNATRYGDEIAGAARVNYSSIT